MDYEIYFARFAAVFLRSLGFIAFLPLDLLPAGLGIRLMLSVALALAGFQLSTPSVNHNILSYPIEFMLGFASVLPLILLLQASEFFAELTEGLRGQTLGGILNPLMAAETAILPAMLKGLLWILLIQNGLPEMLYSNFISGLSHSDISQDYWQNNIILFCEIFAAALALALPFALLILTVESGMMLISKITPTISLESSGFLLRLLLTGAGILILLKGDLITALQNFLLVFFYGRA